ncbi:MAG: hemerythrin domain-containing protein [Coriobacteriia bacterium]|nr:hemerythrin domain-containing protein [Coriobacteriia bacterium]
MAYFEWSVDLETGHQDIDDQHRHLFELANKLQAAALVQEEDDEETVADTIYELTDYVVQHFNDDEELMAEHGGTRCSVPIERCMST